MDIFLKDSDISSNWNFVWQMILIKGMFLKKWFLLLRSSQTLLYTPKVGIWGWKYLYAGIKVLGEIHIFFFHYILPLLWKSGDHLFRMFANFKYAILTPPPTCRQCGALPTLNLFKFKDQVLLKSRMKNIGIYLALLPSLLNLATGK